MKTVVIGTRGSRLAMVQTAIVRTALERLFPGVRFTVVKIKTTGDLIQDLPLEKIGDKGLFIKELEAALLKGEIDLAVHSMKDMPTAIPDGLNIGAVLTRELPWDVVVGSGSYKTLEDLFDGAPIGSSALRRKAQLLHYCPRLAVEPVRGNLDTRFSKLERGDFKALILAYAGIKRLGWAGRITQVLPPEICLPAVGQGAMGIEIRDGDREIGRMISPLHCHAAGAAVRAERAFLKKLGGGCHVPVGALATLDRQKLHLKGMVASNDGRIMVRGAEYGESSNPEQLGISLAEKLLRQGCGLILSESRQECKAI